MPKCTVFQGREFSDPIAAEAAAIPIMRDLLKMWRTNQSHQVSRFENIGDALNHFNQMKNIYGINDVPVTLNYKREGTNKTYYLVRVMRPTVEFKYNMDNTKAANYDKKVKAFTSDINDDVFYSETVSSNIEIMDNALMLQRKGKVSLKLEQGSRDIVIRSIQDRLKLLGVNNKKIQNRINEADAILNSSTASMLDITRAEDVKKEAALNLSVNNKLQNYYLTFMNELTLYNNMFTLIKHSRKAIGDNERINISTDKSQVGIIINRAAAQMGYNISKGEVEQTNTRVDIDIDASFNLLKEAMNLLEEWKSMFGLDMQSADQEIQSRKDKALNIFGANVMTAIKLILNEPRDPEITARNIGDRGVDKSLPLDDQEFLKKISPDTKRINYNTLRTYQNQMKKNIERYEKIVSDLMMYAIQNHIFSNVSPEQIFKYAKDTYRVINGRSLPKNEVAKNKTDTTTPAPVVATEDLVSTGLTNLVATIKNKKKEDQKTEDLITEEYIQEVLKDIEENYQRTGKRYSLKIQTMSQMLQLLGAYRALHIIEQPTLDITRGANMIGTVALNTFIKGKLNIAYQFKIDTDDIEKNFTKIDRYLKSPSGKKYTKNKKNPFDIFLEEINGLYTGKMVAPATQEYYDIIDSIRSKIKNTFYKNNYDKNFTTPAKYGNHHIKAIDKIYEELSANTNIFHFQKSQLIRDYLESQPFLKEIFMKDHINDTYFNFPIDPNYDNYIKDQAGSDILFEKIIEQAKRKIDEYAQQFIPYQSEFNATYKTIFSNDEVLRELEEKENERILNRYHSFIAANHPLYVLNYLDTKVMPLSDDVNLFNKMYKRHPLHSDYMVFIPFKDSPLLNDKFKIIAKDKDLYEFYEWFTMFMEQKAELLPQNIDPYDYYTDLPFYLNVLETNTRSYSGLGKFRGWIKRGLNDYADKLTGKEVGQLGRHLYTGKLLPLANIKGFQTDERYKDKWREILRIDIETEIYLQKLPPNTDVAALVEKRLIEVMHKNKDLDLRSIAIRTSLMANDYQERNQVTPILNELEKYTGYFDLNEGKDKVDLLNQSRYEDWFIRRVLNAVENKSMNVILNEKGVWEKTHLYHLYNIQVKKGTVQSSFGKYYRKIMEGFMRFFLYGKYNSDERQRIRKLLEEARILAEKRAADPGGIIAKNTNINPDQLLADIAKELQTIYAKIYDLGILEMIFRASRFWALGFNAKSAVKNLIEGEFTNFYEAASSEQFNYNDFYRAFGRMIGTVTSWHTFGHVKTPEAKKLRYFVEMYNTLQDNTEESNSYVAQSRLIENIKAFNAYNFTGSAEYFIQGHLLQMVLRNQEIIGKDGTRSNLWDEMKWDSKTKKPVLSENFNTDVNNNYITVMDNTTAFKDSSKEAVALKIKIDAVTVALHGNYSNARSMKVKSSVIGGTAMTLSTWLTEKMNYMYGNSRYDVLTGEIKYGVWRDMTRMEMMWLSMATAAAKLFFFPIGLNTVQVGRTTIQLMFPFTTSLFMKHKYHRNNSKLLMSEAEEASLEAINWIERTGLNVFIGMFKEAANMVYSMGNRKGYDYTIKGYLTKAQERNYKRAYSRVLLSILMAGLFGELLKRLYAMLLNKYGDNVNRDFLYYFGVENIVNVTSQMDPTNQYVLDYFDKLVETGKGEMEVGSGFLVITRALKGLGNLVMAVYSELKPDVDDYDRAEKTEEHMNKAKGQALPVAAERIYNIIQKKEDEEVSMLSLLFGDSYDNVKVNAPVFIPDLIGAGESTSNEANPQEANSVETN